MITPTSPQKDVLAALRAELELALKHADAAWRMSMHPTITTGPDFELWESTMELRRMAQDVLAMTEDNLSETLRKTLALLKNLGA